jgi:hypothetical protein
MQNTFLLATLNPVDLTRRNNVADGNVLQSTGDTEHGNYGGAESFFGTSAKDAGIDVACPSFDHGDALAGAIFAAANVSGEARHGFNAKIL